MFILKLARPER